MAGVALPAGGAKMAQKGIQFGIKAAPKLAEWGTKALPYVPHAVQSLQGIGESLSRTEGQSFGQRVMKAIGAGVINAAGSTVSGGGIAGEVGKRLTNQITNGTVRTATGFGASIGKQALLAATQNAAGHVSDKLVEGELPDANEPGKPENPLQNTCRSNAADAIPRTIAGRKRNLIEATSVMPSAARSTGSVDAK